MPAVTAGGRLPFQLYVARGTEAGVQWTNIRRAVLRLLWGAGTPLGAYEAAERLSTMGRRVHPTSVYRSLRCLVEAGLILPVVTWKKFLIAPDPGGGLWALLLCRACRSCTPVAFSDECPELSQRLSRRGFVRRTCSAEAEGLCRGCTGPAVDPSG